MADSEESFAFLILCRDLLLASKITGSANACGTAIKLIRSADALAATAFRAPALIADLNEPGFLDAAAAWKQKAGGRVIGFAGHADVAAFERAAALGLDETMARGAFVARLESLMSTAK